MASQPSRLVAFASGKGGVGKTVCAANLAVHLAAQRHKVLTVDLDLGCGNLNTSLGVRSVSSSINDFFVSRVPTLSSLKTATAVEGLDLISCSYSPMDSTVLSSTQKERLLTELRSDAADYVFMDLGSGVNDDVLDFFASADIRVLVTGPESLALHNAFVFVKSLTYRIIAGNIEQGNLPKRTRENIIKQLYDGGDQEIGRTIERVRMRDSGAANTMRQVLSSLQIHLILNKVQESAEERFVTNLQQLTKKYVDVDLNYLGSIPYDDNVKKSLNDIVPFALEYKKSPANGAFRTVAGRLDQTLSGVPGREPEPADPVAEPVTQRFVSFLKEAWGRPRIKLQPNPPRSNQPLIDDDSKMRRLKQELDEARRRHEHEKKEWLEEKDQIDRRLEELMAGNEAAARRQVDIQKLEESLRKKDELVEHLRLANGKQVLESEAKIAALEQQFRDSIETIGRLQKQIRLQEAEIKVLRPREPERPVAPSEPEIEVEPDSEPDQTQLRDTPSTIREQLLSTLLEHPWYRITVVRMEEGGVEALQYGDEIAAVLGLAQWVTSCVSSSFRENQFGGLKIIHDNSPQAVDGARILGDSLARAGLEFATQRSSFATEFERIRLVVGKNENGLQGRTLRTPLAADVRST